MKVDRDVEIHRAGQNRFEVRIVQVDTLAVAVDDRAHKAEPTHRPLQFVGRGVGRADGQGGEAGRPIREPAHRAALVVARAGGRQAAGAIQFSARTSDSTARSTLASSIAAMRPSPRSVSCSAKFGRDLCQLPGPLRNAVVA